jgi:DNA polymerase-1
MAIDHIEADDAIAYLTAQVYDKPSNRVTIVSTDRDFLQLVDDRVSVWSPVKKRMYTPDLMREEFGIDAKNYLLYRAITGDKSDNIPGINGVGLKTMIKRIPLITEYTELSVDRLVEYVSDLDKKYKVHELIEKSGDQIKLNYNLMQLKDVDISGDAKMKIMHIAQDEITKMDVLSFKKMFMVDKMYTIIKDLDTWLASAFNPLNAFRSL